jgi:predicted outer membrane repeat protein
MRHIKLSAVVLLILVADTFAQTSISPGEVYGSWGESGSPYLIQGDIVIPNDSTLTIEPGVTVEFQGYYTLDVQGRLLAVGSASQNISFTVNDTTGFYNPDDTLGGWNGIQFIDTPPENDTSKIIFCSLQYGKAVDTVQPGNLGGALYVNNCSKINISNCQISYNSSGGSDSPSGGAISLFSADIIITGNVISHNTALDGGAILIYDSDPVFTGNIIEYNTAGQAGGGVWVGGQSSPVFNSDVISNNTAPGNGGGIICWQTTNTVLNSVNLSNNTAEYGGAIAVSDCEIQINDCNITDNASAWIGGGINAYSCIIDINNTNFERDTAYIFGGAMGIYYSDLNVTNSNLTDNAARILGGGIHSDGSNITLTNVTFERDTTDDSGGAVFTWICDMTISDCDFVDNSSINGGGICFDSCSVFINNSLFNGNNSLWGGAVLGNRGEINLTGCSFNNNTSDHGGAVNTYNCNLQIDSSMFYQNLSQIEGGALVYNADTSAFVSPYDLEINNSVFQENSSLTRSGAISAEPLNSTLPIINVHINRSEFIDNNAQRVGALRIANVPDFTVSNSRFTGNNTEQHTAACTFAGVSRGSVYNCLFEHNSTGSGSSGGAGVSNFAEVTFLNCTFANNKAGSGGGIQMRRGSTATLINNIFWSNYPDQISLNAVNDTSACTLYSYYNNIQFGADSIHISDSVSVIYWGDGNINSDPFFIDTLNNDYHLQDNSPCIAAGIDSIEVGGIWYYCPATDIEGNLRPDPPGTMPDMGAYESQYPVGIAIEEQLTPTEYALYQNYPNPFNPVTKIKYQVPKTTYVELVIYNVLGRMVKTLVDGLKPAGFYELEFNASHLSSGVYFYRLKAGEFVIMKKMVLIK